MDVHWKIDIMTSNDQRNVRFVNCRTELIDDPVARYQVEFVSRLGYRRNRALVRLRRFFHEKNLDHTTASSIQTLFVDDYFEDEQSNVINACEARRRAMKLPPGCLPLVSVEPHYVKYQIALANGQQAFGDPIPNYTTEQRFILRHFTRDARELASSRFYAENGSYSLRGPETGPLKLSTIEVEHIGHFVAVFRRLYGDEQASLKRLCNLVDSTIGSTPFGEWLRDDREALTLYLQQPATLMPFDKQKPMSFTNKELIRSFIYGRFLHQPKAQQEALRAQWATEIGSIDALEFSFYNATKHVASQLINWGRITIWLCKAAGVDLDRDSAGVNADEIQRPTVLPEAQLSAEERKYFESCAANLAFALRSVNDCAPRSGIEMLETSRNHLRAML